jgi:hypothetical protein
MKAADIYKKENEDLTKMKAVTPTEIEVAKFNKLPEESSRKPGDLKDEEGQT